MFNIMQKNGADGKDTAKKEINPNYISTLV